MKPHNTKKNMKKQMHTSLSTNSCIQDRSCPIGLLNEGGTWTKIEHTAELRLQHLWAAEPRRDHCMDHESHEFCSWSFRFSTFGVLLLVTPSPSLNWPPTWCACGRLRRVDGGLGMELFGGIYTSEDCCWWFRNPKANRLECTKPCELWG